MRMAGILIALAALLGVSNAWAQPKGTFRQAHDVGFGNASSLDPISKGRVFQIVEKVISRLVRPDLAGKPSPDLAVSWSANADGTEWTFKLRDGVKFHNGKTFGADEVAYSVTRLLDPKLNSPARNNVKMITTVEAVDARTV